MALSSAKINEIKKKFTKKKLKPILQLALSLLPAALLIMVMMSGYFVELFSLRGIRHEQEVEPSNYNSNLFSNIFNGIRPEFDATGYFENLLDQFTSGLNDPDNILFRVSPANPITFWRYESFDYYGYQTTTRTSEWTNSPPSTRQMGSGFSRPVPSSPDVTTYIVTMNITHSGSYFSFVPTTWSSGYGAYINPSTVRINGSRIADLPSWTGVEILEEYIVDCRGVRMRLTFDTAKLQNSTLSYEVDYLAVDSNELITYSMGISDYSASFIQDWNQIDILYRQEPEGSSLPSGVDDYQAWAPTTYDLALNQLLEYPDNVAAQAFNVMLYLATNYEFDPQMWLGEYLIGQTPHPSIDQDYVEWFLADYKKGVSAHFASALAMILRIQGIPARIVTGWAVGNQTDPAVDRRDITAVYTHSWVEVLVPLNLPGIGSTARWIIFDADPRAGLFYDLPTDVVGGDTPTLEINDTFPLIGSREIFPGENVTFFTLLRDVSGLPIEGADIRFYLRGTDAGRDIFLETVQTNSSGIADHLFVYDIIQHTSGLQVQILANTTVNIGGGDVTLEALSQPFDLRLNHASVIKQSNSRNDPLLASPKMFVYDYISASIFDLFKPLCIVLFLPSQFITLQKILFCFLLLNNS
ncbi:MAG: transglutaminase domain-containing protein [Candidatus Hermodarchaeota archaeon]